TCVCISETCTHYGLHDSTLLWTDKAKSLHKMDMGTLRHTVQLSNASEDVEGAAPTHVAWIAPTLKEDEAPAPIPYTVKCTTSTQTTYIGLGMGADSLMHITGMAVFDNP
ncbi:hypothetical protein KIPB_016515, partial [Kipferlia bialata]